MYYIAAVFGLNKKRTFHKFKGGYSVCAFGTGILRSTPSKLNHQLCLFLIFAFLEIIRFLVVGEIMNCVLILVSPS